MSLVKPIINEIAAFDATVGTTVTFLANGGDQVYANQIKVVLNDGNETTAYESPKTVTYELKNTIPPNVLQNGQYYKINVITYDVLGNTSPPSNYQPFYCYKTPLLTLNISNGQTIRTPNTQIVLTYNQAQGEKVDYAQIDLYNGSGVLISSSGNLYNSDYPPLTFKHDVFGLENHSQYYVQGTTVSINGTVTQTDRVLFYTNFDTIIDENTLTATLDSCNGYVNLHSSIVSKICGESSPDPLSYIFSGKAADLRNATADINISEHAYWAKWNKLFTIPKDFLLRLWFYPARQPFEVLRLSNSDGTSYMKINFRRGTTQDYLSITTDNSGIEDVALGLHCNGNTKIFLWIKVVGNTWDIQFEILASNTTVLEWNSSNNNLSYNVTSDLTYVGTGYETYSASPSNYVDMSDEFTSVIIGNGIFDHLNITTDTSISYTNVQPEWNENDVLNIKFNGDLKNGSPNYTKLVLKRKDATLLNWMNLSEVDVQYNVPTFINFDDSFIPTGIEQEYALVVYVDDVPSEFHTEYITPIWGKYFLSDKTHKFPLNYAVIYSGQVQNIQNGVFMPIGATYPTIVQNGEGNYVSGSLQFKVLGYQYEIDKRLDRISITKQKEDILKFLTNGKAKCLTDFNGNIYILKVINSPQISYDANWGNGIPTISFDWVEQGKYNDYDSMLELGLFDYVTAE